MKNLRWLLAPLLIVLLLAPGSALAQTYLFSLESLRADYYINEDGTASIDYLFSFSNAPSASPLDFVDVGLPNSSFDTGNIAAYVDGQPLSYISRSEYQGSGSGVAIGLEALAIQPGRRGQVQVIIPTVRKVLYPDSQDDNYASTVFSPVWFGSQYVQGDTDMTVVFHLPPAVGPDEPRWHASPSGWPSEPSPGYDDQGRITYTWRNPNAKAYDQYLFGASFPAQYVPESAIVRPSFLETLGISEDDLISFSMCCGCSSFIGIIVWWSVYSAKRRKLQYLPPKIAIEGHGIKRGLTAVEAAVLLEQPMDKIMTMILFGLLKKNAATVVTREPLELEIASPLPADLRSYETDFLKAFETKDKRKRRVLLQEMMVALVKALSNKLKGFSRRETVDYYRDITQRAWSQVEAAQTPEVKSEKYDEVMEWTMLDKDYEHRTRDVFHSGPVFVPIWWHRYDPGFGRPVATASASGPAAAPSLGKGSISAPSLPGASFAAGVVNGVQSFSAGVIGNLTDFTSGVTERTNPVPVVKSSGSHRSGGGGGGGCACACACAGCACACAGGGR
ncbi:MAG: hypothetical protein JXA78_08130 [Anaerolineales bacterium]|nr:hypothetical protein [Anaerolineales bacterium]